MLILVDLFLQVIGVSNQFRLTIFCESLAYHIKSMGKINVKSLQRLCLKRVITVGTYCRLRKLFKRKNLRVQYIREPFLLSTYSNGECLLYFRFSANEIEYLLESLKVPHVDRLKNRIKFTGEEGLCILLRRLSYPSRLHELVPMFKRDEGTISRIFNFMVKWMYVNHAHRLHSLKQTYLTRTVLQELADNSFDNGCLYPNVVGYIDGTCRGICRPKYNQRNLYSGYRKKHLCKYQSVVLANGLIGRLDGPFIGRRHDAAIVHLSRILDEMNSFFVKNDGTWWSVYGDLGYSNQKFIKVGFKNFSLLNREQKEFNRLMSSLRVSVEYGFGKIVQQFPYIDYKKTQKLHLSPLKETYYVAAFLVNCQSCIRGRNQASDIFDSYVPTLEEYLA